jgi:rSAM/selenodomain-associated transferase 1
VLSAAYCPRVFPTAPPPPQRLLIFARLPELGRVKTRLASAVGDERALAAYRAMLEDALRSIGNRTEETEVEVLWAPTQNASGERLRAAFGDHALAMQTGPDLGHRLSMAFSERFFFHRAQKVVAVGVDDPGLSRELIDHAFGLLESCDFVIGPAEDGGYYLIGSRGAVFSADLFAAVPWGTDAVFRTTLNRLRESQRNVAVLPLRRDIDTAADLRHYASTADTGQLATLLREWEW